MSISNVGSRYERDARRMQIIARSGIRNMADAVTGPTSDLRY